MDRPNNLMVIVSLVFLESVPDWERVVEVLRERVVARYPVFRQRAADPLLPLLPPRWVDDAGFSLARHLHRVTLPSPGDDAALQVYVNSQLHRPLDRSHPLWEVHLVSGYGSGAVLVFRAHHALADGIALTRVLLSMTDPEPGSASDTEPLMTAPGGTSGPATRAPGLVDAAVKAVQVLRTSGLAETLALASRTGAVVADVLLTQTPPSALSGTPGPRKRVVWTQPMPLAELKAVGRLAGATLNDVLMSAVAGALEHYQRLHGREPVDLVTMVPVNVRPLDEPLPSELGNRFALVFFGFPSATSAPLARLAETKRRMDWLKQSPEAALTLGIINVLGLTTTGLERRLVDFFANKAIGVTTNVAGPTRQRFLAGVRMTGALGWVPGSGNHTVGACIFTYAGTVRVGFMVDAATVPDPEALLGAFELEVATLASIGTLGTLAGVAGVAGRHDPRGRSAPGPSR
jgi:WS/DGAT/MGAT family acyltransferase